MAVALQQTKSAQSQKRGDRLNVRKGPRSLYIPGRLQHFDRYRRRYRARHRRRVVGVFPFLRKRTLISNAISRTYFLESGLRS